jgi:PAS domain S-box-containing protein
VRLREKSLLIIGGIFVCAGVIMFLVSRNVLLQNFSRLETAAISQNVARAQNALKAEEDSLSATTDDWASWDDTYAFIQTGDENYLKANLVDGTFSSLKLNLVVFINSSGRTVFSKAFDLLTGREVPVPSGLKDHISPGGLLLTHFGIEHGLSGVIYLSESPILIAARPVLTSEDRGPAMGTLVMGRYLDPVLLHSLAQRTSLSLTMYKYGNPQIPGDVRAAGLSLSETNPVIIKKPDEQTIAGYILVQDIYGDPQFILKTDIPRDISKQGQAIIIYFMIVLGTLGMVFGVAAIILLEKTVLSRVTRISDSVTAIGSSGDLSARVTLSGKDELAGLAETINSMLAELRRSHEQIKASEERFRSLIENAFDVVLIVKADETILYASPSLEKVLGYRPDEWTGKKSYEFLFAGDIPEIAKAAAEGFNVKNFTRTLELRLRHKDGSWRTVETAGVNLLRQPSVEGIVINFHDITGRKEAEDRLLELYDKEAGLRQKLETEMRERVEFTRALVHELKTPLTPVLTSSDMLAAELKQEPQLSLAKNISRGATRLNNRIDELLDLVKGEVGTLRLTCTGVDLSRLLRDVVDEIAPEAVRRKQPLQLEPLPVIRPIRGDEDRLRQVVLNLLSNATKYTPDGGKIFVRVKEEGTFAVVEVQDNGPGLAQEEQQRLFTPYYRIENDKRRFSGLGLGLALCKMLVELHGGKIWVSSRIGEGSIFAFSVPLDAAAPERTT